MKHELMTINSGMCGGCEACGSREEMISCTCGEWSYYPIEHPEERFAEHLRNVDDDLTTEQAWLGNKGDDPWAALE